MNALYSKTIQYDLNSGESYGILVENWETNLK